MSASLAENRQSPDKPDTTEQGQLAKNTFTTMKEMSTANAITAISTFQETGRNTKSECGDYMARELIKSSTKSIRETAGTSHTNNGSANTQALRQILIKIKQLAREVEEIIKNNEA